MSAVRLGKYEELVKRFRKKFPKDGNKISELLGTDKNYRGPFHSLGMCNCCKILMLGKPTDPVRGLCWLCDPGCTGRPGYTYFIQGGVIGVSSIWRRNRAG